MTPREIETKMNGVLEEVNGHKQAILPSPAIQNHAAFLSRLPSGDLCCAWFGGSLEGKSDISIYASILAEGSTQWSAPSKLTDMVDRSEQNPVIFVDTKQNIWLFNTAQPHGNQDESRVYMRPLKQKDNRLIAGEAHDTGLAAGTFIRAPMTVRGDGTWLLPLFLCNPSPGVRWTGAFDTAAIASSADLGKSWQVSDVPDSCGSVHMSVIVLDEKNWVAFYRRRQADWVYRAESHDGGKTWSVPKATDVPNNNSSIGVTRLGDGTIAMVCNPISAAQSSSRRASLYDEIDEGDERSDAKGGCNPIWGVERAPMSLCFSFDNGLTFPKRMIIENSTGTCLSNNSLDGRNKELSYPVISPRTDGGLDIAYTLYRRAIKYVRLSAKDIEALAG